jgi:anthranilate/para-aminobenzoate synthase component II
MHTTPNTSAAVTPTTARRHHCRRRTPLTAPRRHRLQVARYHSLYGLREKLPRVLRPLAETADGVVMAVEHTELPFAAVQFHPESILTNPKHGLTILANCLKRLEFPAEEA